MTLLDERSVPSGGPKPTFEGTKKPGEQLALYTFVIVPFVAFLAAVPVAWGWGLGWTDVVLFLAFYVVSGLGITVGFHRLFTHKSFKANRPLRIVTKSGETVDGRRLNEDTYTVQLLDTGGQLRSLAKADIRTLTYASTSPMPSFASRLTSDEIADLVGFLTTLREP